MEITLRSLLLLVIRMGIQIPIRIRIRIRIGIRIWIRNWRVKVSPELSGELLLRHLSAPKLNNYPEWAKVGHKNNLNEPKLVPLGITGSTWAPFRA